MHPLAEEQVTVKTDRPERRSKLEEHPTVRAFRARSGDVPNAAAQTATTPLAAQWLRELCLKCGADDCGFVSMEREEVAEQRQDILQAFAPARLLVSFVCRMNREPVKSPMRSVANNEFHGTGHRVNEVGHLIARRLEDMGIRAMNEPMAFPMEMDRLGTDKLPWYISHKPIAQAAGLGMMGLHRNVIHPRFGNFILLGTIAVDAMIDRESFPLDYNPCLDCNLCVAACPVGAVHTDGSFDSIACLTHNYREFLGGFQDWTEQVVESRDAKEYRAKTSISETVSMWQSMSFGPNYKAAYCLSVCPAGDDVIGEFLRNRKEHTQSVVRPLQEKSETLYVLPGSDAESYASRKWKNKRVKQVNNGLRPETIGNLLYFMPHLFQREKAASFTATLHFRLTNDATADAEAREVTIMVRDGKLTVHEGHQGTPDVRVEADSMTWLRFINREIHIVKAIVTRKVKVQGSFRTLQAFGKCFPGA
jgi:putative sterol carrier protein/Fe-S-cluster-containing hydrogenase component 2